MKYHCSHVTDARNMACEACEACSCEACDARRACLQELRCFERFGGYALQLLPKVIGNIWKHYGIAPEDQQTLLREAGIID